VPSQDEGLIRVLVVHPMRVERVRLIRPMRAQFGRNVEVCEASSVEEAGERLGESFFDVALVPYEMENQSGIDVAARVTTISPDTATLLVVEEETPSLAAEVAQSAACDYVVRGQIDDQQISRAISGAIRQIHLQRDYRQMVRRMNESHDQMDHLIRALSHDMNANFMLMESSFSKLQQSLETERQEDMDLKEVATHVRACMTESRRFLNDLVGLARTGRVEMEPEWVDPHSVVEEVLYEQGELLSERHVSVDVADELPRVWCNRHRLKQVVTNLVRNAVKHGTDPDEPQLTISGSGTCEQPEMAVLRIHDNGPGIRPEWQEEIFMPGRRVPGTESDGTGMGLAIVRKIAQHYGGTVRVESEAGTGTVFEIVLPSVDNHGAVAESRPEFGDDSISEDRRLEHNASHDEDPQLHSHRMPARRNVPRRRFSGSDS